MFSSSVSSLLNTGFEMVKNVEILFSRTKFEEGFTVKKNEFKMLPWIHDSYPQILRQRIEKIL